MGFIEKIFSSLYFVNLYSYLKANALFICVGAY